MFHVEHPLLMGNNHHLLNTKNLPHLFLLCLYLSTKETNTILSASILPTIKSEQASHQKQKRAHHVSD